MKTGRTTYEGWIYGVKEWEYSKVRPLLQNAFEEVDYEFLAEGAGSIFVSGVSALFEENEENMTSTFDLVADQLVAEGKGIILARKWDVRGAVEVTAYEFSPTKWTQRPMAITQ